MSTVKKQKRDPENYLKMSEPFETIDSANEALANFFEEISEIRKKHKVADVLIVCKGSVKYEDGEIGDFINFSHYGNSLNQLPMAAFVYGQTSQDQKEMVNKLLAGKK